MQINILKPEDHCVIYVAITTYMMLIFQNGEEKQNKFFFQLTVLMDKDHDAAT